MRHYFPDVPGLGNVAVSRHAQDRMEVEGTSHLLEEVLLLGQDTPDGQGTVWREYKGMRLVIILRPTPFRGAKLVTTAYLVKPRA